MHLLAWLEAGSGVSINFRGTRKLLI